MRKGKLDKRIHCIFLVVIIIFSTADPEEDECEDLVILDPNAVVSLRFLYWSSVLLIFSLLSLTLMAFFVLLSHCFYVCFVIAFIISFLCLLISFYIFLYILAFIYFWLSAILCSQDGDLNLWTFINILTLSSCSQDVDLNHRCIAKIENLESLRCVEALCLRWNLIKKIENLHTLTPCQI